MKKSNETASQIPCSECSIGEMHKTSMTYFTWANGMLITVPDFPAWVCDICGKREYDHDAVAKMEWLLSCTKKVNPVLAHPAAPNNQARGKRRSSTIE